MDLKVAVVEMASAGSGNQAPPANSLIGGDGKDARVKAKLGDAGAVVSVEVTKGGSGYTSPPDVIFPTAGIPFVKALRMFETPASAVFLIASFLITIALAFYYSFTALYLEQGVGVRPENVAPLMTIGQWVEIFFLLTLALFLRQFGMKWVLIVGMAAWGVRYAIFAAKPPLPLIILGIALHGICFDFFFAAGMIHTEDIAAADIKASAQSLFGVLTYGLGMWLGTEASGWLNQYYTKETVDPATGEKMHVTDWGKFWLVPCHRGPRRAGVVRALLLTQQGTAPAHPKAEAVPFAVSRAARRAAASRVAAHSILPHERRGGRLSAAAALTFSAPPPATRPIILATHPVPSCGVLPIPVKAPLMQPVPTIPGYELLAPLGGGPISCVYSARDGENDSPCAVKVLRAEWADDPVAIKLLQREARVGLSVRHPHLVRVLFAHVLTPPYFLVMDLLPGQSLRRRLRRDYRLDVHTSVWIARQTAEALTALHRAGFVHGDIKPDNVRLVDDGNAVLIDLGFAHRPGENNALLRDGYVLGTANYLAPELCRPQPHGEAASDLFSLGVTLFEMLTGQLPYPPGTLGQTFRRHGCDPPADVRRCGTTVPRELAELVDRLLAHRPEERPRASQVVRQLIGLEIAALRRRGMTSEPGVATLCSTSRSRESAHSVKSPSVRRLNPAVVRVRLAVSRSSTRMATAARPPGPTRSG